MPAIIPVIAITSVILTTITNNDKGYYCVPHTPQRLMIVGFPEQWVLPRNYWWLASSFCFVSNVKHNMTV